VTDRSRALDELEVDLDRLSLRVARAGGPPGVEAWLRRARRLVVRASDAARPRVAVVGASADRGKFGNKAVRAFLNAGFEVYPVNPNAGQVEGLKAYPSLLDVPPGRVDRVTVYVPPEAGLKVLDEAAARGVGEVWLNPGADAPAVVARAEALGLDVVQACSILGVGQHPARL
jgi:predicted CoA-binding protein